MHCDFGHESDDVRRLPNSTSDGSAIFVCKAHYMQERRFRMDNWQEVSPDWDALASQLDGIPGRVMSARKAVRQLLEGRQMQCHDVMSVALDLYISACVQLGMDAQAITLAFLHTMRDVMPDAGITLLPIPSNPNMN